jgi:hypothetical protein
MKVLLVTLLAVLLGGGAFVWSSWARFTAATEADVGRLVAGAKRDHAIVGEQLVASLPAPVARHLRRAGVVGKPIPGVVRVRQVGRIRSSADASWMPLEAEEVYSVDPPAFVWQAWLPRRQLPLVFGRDEYLGRRGSIVMKLLGTVAVADDHGEALAAAGLMRFLNEMMWFPAAFAGPGVEWRAVDDGSADIALRDGPLEATARLFFDGEGRLVNFRAQRFNTGTDSIEAWETPLSGHRIMAGLELPTKGAAVWKLPAGDFTYIELEITAVEYD